MAARKPIVNIAGTKQEMPAGDTVPVANGGTGLTAPGASGNVLTSNGTAWYSAAPSGGAGSTVVGSATITFPNSGLTETSHRDTVASNITFPEAATKVAYGNGRFVAIVAYSTNAYVSPDGKLWSLRTISSYPWKDLIYANGLFIAVSSGTGTSVIATSVDGDNWNIYTSPTDWPNNVSVAYGNGVFVIVGYNSTSTVTSTDAITWTLNTSAIPLQNWYSIAFGNGIFVAVPVGGSTTTAYSTNGVTWNTATGFSVSNCQDVCFGNGIFVAVNQAGASTTYNTTVDGTTWTSRSIPSGSRYFTIFDNGIFFTPSYNTTTFHYSLNGIDWTAGTLPSSTSWFIGAAGNNIFLSMNTSTIEAYWNSSLIIDQAATYPGTNQASVTVLDDGVQATHRLQAFLMGSTTADHNAYEHEIVPMILRCGNIVPNTSFDIIATSDLRLRGDFTAQWTRN